MLILFPLVSDILLYHLEIYSNRWDKVSSGPETFLSQHFLISEPIVNFDGWFSFQLSHNVCNGILWSYSYNHMNVIFSNISLNDFKIESFGKLLQYSSEFFSDSLKKDTFSIFWNNHDVECTVPLRVRLGIIGAMRHTFLWLCPL